MLFDLMPVARILAIEEDPLLANQLQNYLQRSGHCVTVSGAADSVPLAESGNFDLILLAILGAEGLTRLQQLRRRSEVPVLLMSAQGDEQCRIAGFRMGADDYLAKPFNLAELAVRVMAILRRVAYERQGRKPEYCPGELCFDDVRLDVTLGDSQAGLTVSEYRVLQLLHQHRDQILSKAFLYQRALRRCYARYDRSLDMHISHTRRKLQAIGYPSARLETIWGQGYMLAGNDS